MTTSIRENVGSWLTGKETEMRPNAERVANEMLVAYQPREVVEEAFDWTAHSVTPTLLMLHQTKASIFTSAQMSWQRMIDGHQSLRLFVELNRQSGEGAKQAAAKQKRTQQFGSVIMFAPLLINRVFLNESNLAARIPLINRLVPTEYDQDAFEKLRDQVSKYGQSISQAMSQDAQVGWTKWQFGEQPLFQAEIETMRWSSEREKRSEGEAYQQIQESARSGLDALRRIGDLEQRVAGMSA